MKKTFYLEGLDCPNCAAKIEKEMRALEGVSEASINLIKQTLTVEAYGNTEGLLDTVERIVHSHEKEVSVSEHPHEESHGHDHCHCHGHEHGHGHDHEHGHGEKNEVIRLIIGAAVYVLGIICASLVHLPLPVYLTLLIAAYLILGCDVIFSAVKNIIKGRVFDENFLMSLSTVGAFAIGEYYEAVAVMLFYQIGEFFQGLAVRRSRRSISELMDIRSDFANLLRGGDTITVSPDEVGIGETILIKPGERVPLDGIVISGSSSLDTRALTGESLPRDIREGDEILSGSVNQSGVLTVRVTRTFGESTASRIIDLVENASAKKARTENFITSFARYYTPAVVIFAALLAVIPPIAFNGLWADWVHRAMVFLVISCPCALVISIPLTFFGGIGAASRHGILVKGGNYLEALTKLDTVIFDKTGTLTRGVFKVTDTVPAEGVPTSRLIELAALAESFSSHPIARSIIAEYGSSADTKGISDYRDVPGKGIYARLDGCELLVGKAELLSERGIVCPDSNGIGTKVFVALDGAYMGHILISDEIKSDSAEAIAGLRSVGIEKTVMLTGDSEDIAKHVSDALGIDEYHASLLPDEKLEALERLSEECRGKLAFVGDGINDAPVLARADVGIAMGALGSDAAIEAADVVLMTDEPSKLVKAIRLARATRTIVVQNIVLTLSVKGIFLVLGAFGVASMWEAVFGDVGVALLAVLNSMRILKK